MTAISRVTDHINLGEKQMQKTNGKQNPNTSESNSIREQRGESCGYAKMTRRMEKSKRLAGKLILHLEGKGQRSAYFVAN